MQRYGAYWPDPEAANPQPAVVDVLILWPPVAVVALDCGTAANV
jgi:hypothetical protein